jgi:dolichyl-phosphate-mannose--protein O-mannosyl transferase
MKKRDLAMLSLLFSLAFGLRFYDLATPDFQWGDEVEHVAAATHYWTEGHFDPNLWEHPPLRHVLLYGFLQTFGDNPYGWRLRNVLLGAMAAVLVALLAFSADGSRVTAAVAGLLIATDPLHVMLSRFTFEEIYGGAFFVAALVAFVYARGRNAWLVASALLMGCALATKWYYVPVWLTITALALREDDNYRRPADALFVACTFLLLPVLVYVLAFVPWFRRGYSVGELVELTTNAYYSLQHMPADTFNPALPYLRPTNATDWFVAPAMFGQAIYPAPDRGQFIIFANNLPVWGLTLPSVALCSVLAVKRRSLRLGLPVLFFLATYALFVVVRRPTLIYSTIPLLPFAFSAIGVTVSWLSGRLGRGVGWGLATAMLVANLYLYPLVTAKEVPLALYTHVLSKVDLTAP